MAIKYATDETYEKMVAEGVVLVDFFGVTCGPCKLLSRELEELEDTFPFINIVKVDVDKCPDTARKFEIKGIPHLYYYKDGKIAYHELGAMNGEVISKRLAEILY